MKEFSIKDGALKKYKGVGDNVVIPKGVTSIGRKAFYFSSIKSITIPQGVVSIGEKAFSYCDRLTDITIPQSVVSIGDSAFRGCDSLTSVTIPQSIISIGDSAFWGCSNLIYNEKDGLKYLGNEINPHLYLLGATDESITTATIDDNCKVIGNNAFSRCRNLTNITIPQGVTGMGAYAFSYCESLTSVILPSGITSIGDYAFFCCKGLKSIVIMNCPSKVDYSKVSDYAALDIRKASVKILKRFCDKANSLGVFFDNLEKGIEYDQSVVKENIAYARKMRKKLYGYALNNSSLLRALTVNGIMPLKDAVELSANDELNIETQALLAEYVKSFGKNAQS